MKALFILTFLLTTLLSQAQTNISMSFAICPTSDCWGKNDSIIKTPGADGIEQSIHQFSVLQTVGGQYVTPIINYLYFTFPSVVKVIRCTNDSFPKPVNTATSGK